MNRLLTTAGLVLVILAACSPAPGTPASEEPEDSVAASTAPQASQGGGEGSLAPGVVADLEALIPNTIGDITMTKQSMRGSQYLVDPDSDPAFVQFLEDIGVPPSNVSMAVGFGFSADFTSGITVVVFRAEGADSNALRAAFKESLDTDPASPMEWASASVGGKQFETSVQDSGTSYLYVSGDTLFFIVSDDPGLVEVVLAGLP